MLHVSGKRETRAPVTTRHAGAREQRKGRGMAPLAPVLPELGRIRLGDQQPVKGQEGRMRPNRLDRFRLTSENKPRLDYAVSLGWGDEVTAWASPLGPQWQLYCTVDALTVVIPQEAAFSQYDELWHGSECIYRCDGHHLLQASIIVPADGKQLRPEALALNAILEHLSEGMPCACEQFEERVPTVTRLSVFLPEMPGIGVWRLDTRGFYAGGELQGIANLLQAAAARQQYIEADLAISYRKVRRQGQTRTFPVPTLQPREMTMGHLLGGRPQMPALPPPSDADVFGVLEKTATDPTDTAAAYDAEKQEARQQFLAMGQEYSWSSTAVAAFCRENFPHAGNFKDLSLHSLQRLLDHGRTYGKNAMRTPLLTDEELDAGDDPTEADWAEEPSDNPNDLAITEPALPGMEGTQVPERVQEDF